MAQVIDLNVLVPDDICFRYGDPPADYAVPGDLDTDSVLRLFKLFGELIENAALDKLETATTDDDTELDEETRRISDRMKTDLLAIFQIRQPELTSLPFGAMSTRIVLRTILEQLGVLATPGGADDADPPRPARKKKPQTGRSRSSRSRPK